VVKTTGSHADYFRADRAWFYVVLLTLGYLGSRGLANAVAAIITTHKPSATAPGLHSLAGRGAQLRGGLWVWCFQPDALSSVIVGGKVP
jgi:hypothetical protein